MTKIDIISGFLGAGKTTFIKKLIKEAYGNEKLVLIENEFGEIGIDGGFLKEAGIQIKEMNSGCICCSLVGDFATSLKKVMQEYHPQRIIIEPSGVGKLSDVVKAVLDLHDDRFVLNSLTTVVDGNKCALYMKNFGEFFNNQIEHAHTIVLSRTQVMDMRKLTTCVAQLQKHNATANLITTPWDDIDGKQILAVMEQTQNLEKELLSEMEICPECHHHDDEHDKGCDCEQHHEKHQHHEHDEECSCKHHHKHDETCSCGHHHVQGHHHADEIFQSWGKETIQVYSEVQLQNNLETLSKDSTYGTILRAKGMVESNDKTWLYFDFVPGEFEIRKGNPATIGKLCVIGSNLNEALLNTLFLFSERM